MTHIYIGKECWHKIEDINHFVKRWQKAMRKKRFFLVRYAGTDYWVNPSQITCVSSFELW